MAAAVVGYNIDPEGEQKAADPSLAAAGNDPFSKWIDPTVSAMRRLTSYFQPEIRNKAVATLRHVALSRWFLVSGGAQHGGLGAPAVRRQALPASVAPIVTAIIPLLLLRMKKDFSKTVAATCVETLDMFVRDMGAACVMGLVGGASFDGAGDEAASGQQRVPILDAAMQQILLFMQGKAMCQSVEDEDDGEEGEEDEEEDHDFILMDSVTDLVGGLARAIGPEFAPFVVPLLQPLGRFLAPSRPHTDKSMAIGCYADLVGSIGPSLGANTAGSLLHVGMAGLADTSGGGEVQVSVAIVFDECWRASCVVEESSDWCGNACRS